MNILEVTVGDGKYTIVFGKNGSLKALRYGKEWQDLTGNGMVLALAQEIQNLKDQINLLKSDSDISVPVKLKDLYVGKQPKT